MVESDCGSNSDINEDADKTIIQFTKNGDSSNEEEDRRANPVIAPDDTPIIALISRIVWDLRKVKPNDILRPKHTFYNGPCGIRWSAALSFNTPTEEFEYSGGMTKDFKRGLVVNSNHYFNEFKKPNLGPNIRYCRMKWTNISVSEMYRFLGMLLKIFIMERDRGGYTAYFSKGNKRLFTGDHRSGSWVDVKDSAGWAWKYMTLGRFKQLRGLGSTWRWVDLNNSVLLFTQNESLPGTGVTNVTKRVRVSARLLFIYQCHGRWRHITSTWMQWTKVIKEDFKWEGLLERPISKSGTKNCFSRSSTSY